VCCDANGWCIVASWDNASNKIKAFDVIFCLVVSGNSVPRINRDNIGVKTIDLFFELSRNSALLKHRPYAGGGVIRI
jgi:hypothetical protein